MIREIQAKTLLQTIRNPDGWFGVRLNMNLYRGCQHRCIYCDSRSECYQVERFDDEVLVKANAIDLLEKELPRKRDRGVVGTGSMSDPYTPAELRYNLTGRALKVIARLGFPVHLTTKSDLVLRDLETLRQVNRQRASVSFTLTTVDDDLARKVEPAAPLPSARLKAMKVLSDAGILTGVTLMPVLPFLEDSEENLSALVRAAADHGARYILPWFGVSLRDRQRAYYYAKLDQLFPGLSDRYRRAYGGRYFCPVPRLEELSGLFQQLCRERGLITDMTALAPRPEAEQLSLF